MPDYDVTLKSLLRGGVSRVFEEIAGARIGKWLDVEFPRIRNPRADLIGELEDHTILHVELQSTNDSEMAIRMAEYCLGVYRMFGSFPRQIVLYVGEAPLRMQSYLQGKKFDFAYDQVDARDIDGDGLLESEQIGDNVIAILTRLRDRHAAVREIVGRIGELNASGRKTAVEQLLVLAGLRGLEEIVRGELEKMPILADIMDHKVIGPEIRRGRELGLQEGRREGLEAGRQEGRQEGLQKGRQEGLQEGLKKGEQTILKNVIERRFGTVPSWATDRLGSMTPAELEDLSTRLLDANTLQDLFK